MSHRRPPAPIVQPLDAGALFALKTDRSVHRPAHYGAPPSALADMPPQHPASNTQHPASPRRGLTLIEMLVALAVTLVMMAAVVNLFANLSGSIRNRRAMIEAGAQLRQVRQRMQLDLAGATCRGRTWVQPAENQGYIEYIEGSLSDSNPTNLTIGPGGDIDTTTSLIPGSQIIPPDSEIVTDASALGDWDDVLALTVRSESDPFNGKSPYFNMTTNQWEVRVEQSQLAEVIWFAGENDASQREPGMRRVYRRQLIIAPWIIFPPLADFSGATAQEKLADFYSKYDVSVRIEAGRLIANTLGDLTKREFRHARAVDSVFPHHLLRGPLSSRAEYLALNDSLAFDVRVYDPGAPLYTASNGTVVQPGDPGWLTEVAVQNNLPSSYGAYVDLGWGLNRDEPARLHWPRDITASNNTATIAAPMQYWQPFKSTYPAAVAPLFHVPHQAGWHPRNRMFWAEFPAVYDTWSFHYENDGLNQDAELLFPAIADTVVDQGTNGLDDPVIYDTPVDTPSAPAAAAQAFGVDDIGERETSPPYDVALTGLQVRFRIYEPDARQIREASVTQSFGL